MTKAEKIAKLRSFADLQENWDSYGAMAVDPRAIEYAVMLVEQLPEEALDYPVPMNDGGVMFDSDHGATVEVWFASE